MKSKFSEDTLSYPEKKKSYNKWLFSVVAPKYNLVTRLLSFNRDKAWKRVLLQMIPPVGKGVILDIASGTGDIAYGCKKRFPEAKVVASDLSPEMVSQAPEKAKCSLPFSLQDMNHLGIKSNSVDVVCGSYALRNAPDPGICLTEINRVLKPDGKVILLDFAKFSNPILSKAEFFFLYLWGALWGVVLHGNPEIYSYIAKSLNRFPDNKHIIKLFRKHGFSIRKRKFFMFGVTALYEAEKIGK
ncbi:2-heptaprenyl-1,4-naphthoquinone methyltransferase [Chitinispirillum alkaliphilum]|nr:2-heptaprenyl-1,4-naphthoquinone methyltransferase [Chitinispirillum alkaliphilum]